MQEAPYAVSLDRPPVPTAADLTAARRKSVLDRVEFASVSVNSFLAALGGALILLQVLITCADVFARYVFNRPIEGAIEVQQMLLAYVALVPVAYTFITGGHVRFTLFLERFRPRGRALLEILSAALGLIFFGALAWGGFESFWSSWQAQESMVPPLPLPYWLPKFFLPFGAVLMIIQLVIWIARQAQVAVGHATDERDLDAIELSPHVGSPAAVLQE